MNRSPSSPSSLSRRGFLTTAGTLGTAVGLGSAQTTTTLGTTTSTKDAPKPDWTFPKNPDSSSEKSQFRTVYPVSVVDSLAIVVTVSNRGSQKNERYAFHGVDIDRGTKRWSHEFSGLSLPIIDDGTIYVQIHDSSGENKNKTGLAALNAKTGSVLWQQKVGASLSPFQIGGGYVYVLGHGSGSVVVLDDETGKEAWRFEPDRASKKSRGLNFFDDTLYVNFGNTLYALSSQDGTKQWERTFDDWKYAYLSQVVETNLYHEENGTLYALNPDDGSEEWSIAADGVPFSNDGVLYSWGDSLKAIDPEDGSIHWQYETDGGNRPRGRPVVADGTIFGATTKGTVSAITTDGSEKWTFSAEQTDGYARTVLDVQGDSFYFMYGSTLYVLSTEDGSLKWSRTGAGRGSNLVVTDDDVLFGTRNELYVFDRHHSLLSTVVDGTTGFLSSGPGFALSGVIVGTAAFAAYRRFNDGDGDSAAVAAESPAEPELEYGRLERLAEDEFTETYRVRKRTDDGPKIVAERQLTNPRVSGTFRSAVERWAELNDRPGVVPVLETDGDSIELPYYEDGSLADSDRPLSERLDALSAAGTVVHDAHTDGLIHGGLTPASIFFDGEDVAVADWELGTALADFCDSSDPSPYDTPEQIAGEEADERTDVYRLGAIAAFILTGKTPAEGSLRALDPGHREVMLAQADPQEAESLRDDSVSEDLFEIIAKAMAEDPNDRYESVVAFDDMFRWAAFRA